VETVLALQEIPAEPDDDVHTITTTFAICSYIETHCLPV